MCLGIGRFFGLFLSFWLLYIIYLYYADTTSIVYCLGPYVKYFKQLHNCGSTLDKTKLFVTEAAQVVIIHHHVLTDVSDDSVSDSVSESSDGISDYCLQYCLYY